MRVPKSIIERIEERIVDRMRRNIDLYHTYYSVPHLGEWIYYRIEDLIWSVVDESIDELTDSAHDSQVIKEYVLRVITVDKIIGLLEEQ